MKHNSSKINTSNVLTLYCTFYNNTKATNTTTLANWNTSNVTTMEYMFRYCTDLAYITSLANWNVSNTANMQGMFNGCSSLINTSALASWDVSNVTNIPGMFAYTCLTTLDMSGWNTGKVTDAGSFLFNCSNLTTWKVNYLLFWLEHSYIPCIYLETVYFLKC